MDLREDSPVLMYVPRNSFKRINVDPKGIEAIESSMSYVPMNS